MFCDRRLELRRRYIRDHADRWGVRMKRAAIIAAHLDPSFGPLIGGVLADRSARRWGLLVHSHTWWPLSAGAVPFSLSGNGPRFVDDGIASSSKR